MPKVIHQIYAKKTAMPLLYQNGYTLYLLTAQVLNHIKYFHEYIFPILFTINLIH